MNIDKIFSEVSKKLDELDQNREKILNVSREMIRNCSIAIKSIHRNELSIYQEKLTQIKSNYKELSNLVDKDTANLSRYLKTPEQEYVEAICLFAIIHDQSLPSPEECGVKPINYVLGLADVIGELRRFILDKIRRDEFDDLEKYLDIMENIYTYLFSLDYPKSITHDLRRKTDVARGIIEKTRGDISLSIQINKFNQKLQK